MQRTKQDKGDEITVFDWIVDAGVQEEETFAERGCAGRSKQRKRNEGGGTFDLELR